MASPEPVVAIPVPDKSPIAVVEVHSKAGVSKDGALPKNSTARTPKSERKTPPSDLDRLQGEWEVVEQTNASKVSTKEDLARTKTVWKFDGNTVTVRNHSDAPELVYYQGTIKFHPDLSPKRFEFAGKNRTGQAAEMLGIYGFEGAVLVLRYRVHRTSDARKPFRPDSLKIEPGPAAGTLVRLRHVKK
jgi:uncharacterized protein (TIGR03067 family)